MFGDFRLVSGKTFSDAPIFADFFTDHYVGMANFIHHLVKVHWIFFQLCVQLPSPLHPVWLIAVKQGYVALAIPLVLAILPTLLPSAPFAVLQSA